MDNLGDVLNDFKDRLSAQQGHGDGWSKLMCHFAVRKFREKYPELTDDQIRKSQMKVRQMATEFDNCSSCMSLDHCKHVFKGHATALEVSDLGEGRFMITDRLRPCKHNRRPPN
jgi:primosomal protein DnaI